MKVFLIIVAVLAVIIIAVCSLSATVTLVYDKQWKTRIKVLFIEKDISLSKILSFIMFPEKKAEQVSGEQQAKKKKKLKAKKNTPSGKQYETWKDVKIEPVNAAHDDNSSDEKSTAGEASAPPAQPKNSNPLKKLWDEEGIIGILSLLSNVLETANSAVLTLIRGLHIYSLYVMIIVGGNNAAAIGRAYGSLCQFYYPVKGLILNQMKVDSYDDYIQPDFLAERTEFEFQLIASISVGLLLKVGIKAVFIFLKNIIQNKKQSKKAK